MTRHRTSRARLSKRPTPDNRRAALPEPEPEPDEVNCLLDVLRDNLRRGDAMITTAERQIEEASHDDGGDDGDVEEEFDAALRHRMRIEYLVEAGKLAVRAALYTTGQLGAALTRRRSA